MIDLGLNQNKIKEIKYEVKEGKTVIFKLQNSNLEDVEIVIKSPYSCMTDDEKQEYIEKLRRTETAKTAESVEDENVVDTTNSGKKEIDLKKLMSETKAKELHDYEPVSCLKGENGMEETLEASRKKEWKINYKPKLPSDEEIDNILKNNSKAHTDFLSDHNNTLKASSNEIREFKTNQKKYDTTIDVEYRDKIEKKLAKDLINSKMLIDDYVYKMSKSEKEAFSKRIKEKYFTDKDKYDEFSKILSLNCLNSRELDENEKKTLDASKNKEWEEDIKNHEINPNNYKIVSLDEKYKDASKEEKEEVSREIIQKDAKIDTDIIKERNKDRTKDEYYKGDPNDEYSKIKSFGDVDVEKTEFVDFLKDEPVISKNAKEFLTKNGMKYIGQMKIDRKTDEIIDFKPNDNNKK